MLRRALLALLLLWAAPAVAQFNGCGPGFCPNGISGLGFNVSGGGGGGGGPTPYTGQVVSRTIIPDDVNTTNKQLRGRRILVAKDAINGTIQLVFPNFYVDGFGAGATYQELGPGGTATLTFAIEYPLGTNGVAGTCPSGGVIANVSTITCTWTGSIPQGGVFGVRTFLTSAAGIVFSLGISGYPAPAANVPGNFQFGDVLDSAVSGLTDNTTNGGAYTSTGGSSSYGPILVAGTTVLPSVLAIGDSIDYGENDAGDGSGDVGAVARWTNPLFATASWGTRGQDAGQFVANCTIRCSFSSFFTHLVNEDGINGFIHGQSAATVATNTTALGNKFPSLTKFITTITPSATSTDNYVTLGNQTLPSYSAGAATENARRRAVPAPFVGVFDSAASLESTTGSGLVAVQGGGTGSLLYYVQAASSVHPVWGGYYRIAQSNLATAASVINRNGTPLTFSPRLFTYEQDHVEDSTSQSTYTFTGTRPNGVLVGSPNPNRLVVANCIARFGTTGATTVSMTIGGVAASKVAFGGVTAENTNVTGGTESLHTLWFANVPNGNTATISAVYSTTMLRAGCDIWTVVGLSGVPTVSGATTSGVAGTTVTNAMTVPAGGSVIVGTSTINGTVPTVAMTPTGFVQGILGTGTLVAGTLYYGSGSITQPGSYTIQSAWSLGGSTTGVAGAFSPAVSTPSNLLINTGSSFLINTGSKLLIHN